MPDGSFILQSCFINLAVEHWFGSCPTESGYSRDISAIEILLINEILCTGDQSNSSLNLTDTLGRTSRGGMWQVNLNLLRSYHAYRSMANIQDLLAIISLKLTQGYLLLNLPESFASYTCGANMVIISQIYEVLVCTQQMCQPDWWLNG